MNLLSRAIHRTSVIWALIGLILVLTGCASLVSRGALSPPKLNLDILSDEQMQSIGYREQRYCGDGEASCLAYLQASAYDQASREHWQLQAQQWAGLAPLTASAMEVRLRFWPGESAVSSPLADSAAIGANSEQVVMRYVIELQTTRGDDILSMVLDTPVAENTKGTYLLVHGFRTNKESLFFVAEALRYYGYDVILVDLFGHGDSSGDFTFSGRPDARQMSSLIDELALETPLHLLGMSMGGTTATHLSGMRDDIQSLTLLAPMLEFVDAFVDAGRAYTRTAHLVPQSTLEKGAQYALNEVSTPKEDTAVVRRVGELNIPVLILGSADDKVSPFNKLTKLATGQVTVYEVEPRTHHGMILWDSDDVDYWYQWLQSTGTQ